MATLIKVFRVFSSVVRQMSG